MSSASGLTQNPVYNNGGLPLGAQNPMLRRIQTLPDAAYTFKNSDSGCIFNLSTVTAARVFTLPAVADNAGMWFDVVVKVATGANTCSFTSASGAGTVMGMLTTVTSNASPTIPTLANAVAANSIANTAANTSVGDRFSFFCDGAYWQILGVASTQNKAATAAWA